MRSPAPSEQSAGTVDAPVFSGATLEDAVRAAEQVLGGPVHIVSARSIRQGLRGLMGREHVEVVALPRREPAPTVPPPRSHPGLDAQDVDAALAGLLAAAERLDGAGGRPRQSTPPSAAALAGTSAGAAPSVAAPSSALQSALAAAAVARERSLNPPAAPPVPAPVATSAAAPVTAPVPTIDGVPTTGPRVPSPGIVPGSFGALVREALARIPEVEDHRTTLPDAADAADRAWDPDVRTGFDRPTRDTFAGPSFDGAPLGGAPFDRPTFDVFRDPYPFDDDPLGLGNLGQFGARALPTGTEALTDEERWPDPQPADTWPDDVVDGLDVEAPVLDEVPADDAADLWEDTVRAPDAPTWSAGALLDAGVPAEVVAALPAGEPADQLAWVGALAGAIAAVAPLPAVAGPDVPAVVHGFGPEGALAILRAAVAGTPPGTLTMDGRTVPATPAELALAVRCLIR